MLTRLKHIMKFLKGDYIILMKKADTLVVDAGNHSKEDIRSAASVFFKTAYTLLER